MKNRKNKVIIIRIPDDLRVWLEDESDKQGISISKLVRHLLFSSKGKAG